jgi:hypothetical protein
MLKMLVAFLSLFLIFFFGIEIFRSLTRREKWDTVKTVTYSLAIAAITVVTLIVIVILF